MPVLELAVPSATLGNVLVETSAQAAQQKPQTPAQELAVPSATLGNVLAETPEQVAHRIPVIAGSVVGGIMGFAYIIGFTIYFVKRCKRKRLHRRIEAGKAEPKVRPEPTEKIVIPPDPAVLLGHNRPGEFVAVDERRHHHRQKSVPKAQPGGSGSTSHLVGAGTDRVSDEVTVPTNI
ncbi:hypothetical protein DFH07DRAFT_167305 [Mycena maculata]|uniref:Uncharacterized protein n=1 Tax=Mycena maculata TaxID=230809 RepID=A0AAD7JZK8_9AGAR|nr:hypothetical protein DFH07DRAFT_167305 [Mycena maculata]